MKVVNEVTITIPGHHSTHAILDLSEDLILSESDALELIYKYKEHSGYTPRAIWLNINQAYALTSSLLHSTGSESDPKDTAKSIASLYGITVYLKGRDIEEVKA